MSEADATRIAGFPTCDVMLVACLACGRRGWFRADEVRAAELRRRSRCAGCGSRQVTVTEAYTTRPHPGLYPARLVEYTRDNPAGDVIVESSSAHLCYLLYDLCRAQAPDRRHVLTVHGLTRRDSKRDG